MYVKNQYRCPSPQFTICFLGTQGAKPEAGVPPPYTKLKGKLPSLLRSELKASRLPSRRHQSLKPACFCIERQGCARPRRSATFRQRDSTPTISSCICATLYHCAFLVLPVAPSVSGSSDTPLLCCGSPLFQYALYSTSGI